MLAEAVRNNLKNVQKMDIKTKAKRFSDLFQRKSFSDDTETLSEVLAKAHLTEYIKKESPEKIEICEEPLSDEDYIIENPDELVVPFPIVSNVKLEEKLPFFKSISFKLSNIYG